MFKLLTPFLLSTNEAAQSLGVVLNSSMNWNEVSIHTTTNSYPESATPLSVEASLQGCLSGTVVCIPFLKYN